VFVPQVVLPHLTVNLALLGLVQLVLQLLKVHWQSAPSQPPSDLQVQDCSGVGLVPPVGGGLVGAGVAQLEVSVRQYLGS
jgi:hypothetical protein